MIVCEGNDEDEALKELVQLVEDGLGEYGGFIYEQSNACVIMAAGDWQAGLVEGLEQLAPGRPRTERSLWITRFMMP